MLTLEVVSSTHDADFAKFLTLQKSQKEKGTEASTLFKANPESKHFKTVNFLAVINYNNCTMKFFLLNFLLSLCLNSSWGKLYLQQN